MVSFLFAVINLVVLAPAFRTKTGRHKANTTVAVMSKDDCAQLGSIGNIRGQPVGQVAELVCKFWPGENFPVGGTSRVLELINYVAAEGGLWDRLVDLRKSREKNERFCYRQEQMRTVVASNCEMTFNGTCYGACPSGYQPAGLVSAFAPVCTSICATTLHPTGCGFGCSNTRANCIRTIVDQVTSVVSAIGKVSSYVFANPAIAVVAEQVVEVVNFALTTLVDIVGYAKQIKEAINDGEQQVALVIMIFQILMESGLVENIQMLSSMIGDTGKAIVELVQGGFDWTLPNLDRIADIILTNGADILETLYDVTSAFMYPRCEKAESAAIFSIEDVGDERLAGPWIQRGEHSGKPKYTLVNTTKTILEWSDSRNAWRMYVDNWWGFNRKTLYQANVQNADYPVTGWELGEDVPAPEPTILVMNR